MASPRTAYSIESFYHDHHGWLQGWLHRRIGCPERAADFAQESFLRVLVRPPVEKLDQPRAFLTRIATRLIIDDSRRARLEQAWLEVQTAFAQEHLHAPSAEEVNEWLDLLEWVARLVQELPDKPRRAFLMSRLDGMAQGRLPMNWASPSVWSRSTWPRPCCTATRPCILHPQPLTALPCHESAASRSLPFRFARRRCRAL